MAIQARDTTLDVDVSKIENLLENLLKLRVNGKESGIKQNRLHQIYIWKSSCVMGVKTLDGKEQEHCS